jgi:hypothetical protein
MTTTKAISAMILAMLARRQPRMRQQQEDPAALRENGGKTNGVFDNGMQH